MKKIVVIGAGKNGKRVANDYGVENILCFADNNPNLTGKALLGKKIISVEELIEKYFDYYQDFQIIISPKHPEGIVKQLENADINKYVVYKTDKAKFYYPGRFIVNDYIDTMDINEDEWNLVVRGNPIQDEIRNEILKIKDSLPLFNHIEIETLNRCNGNCMFCPVNQALDSRKYQKMSKELFYKIIGELAELHYTGRIALFSNNEPFLDDRMIEFHKYAREKLPDARFHLFTNGTLLDINKFLGIMEYLDELIIDNYQQELKLIRPVQEIVTFCNEHPDYKKRVTVVMRKPDEILTTRGGDAPNRKNKLSYENSSCILPYKQMIIRPDGNVSLCCNDPLGKNTMGNVQQETLYNIWYGVEFQKVRDALLKGRGQWPHCKYCDYFNMG